MHGEELASFSVLVRTYCVLATVWCDGARTVTMSHGDSAQLRVAGCGTGLAAAVLKQEPAFANVDGTDISAEMLQEASKLNIYEQLFEGDLNQCFEVSDDAYDAIVCVGTFTHGHVKPQGMRELLRITKAGGVIALSVNEGVWEQDGYAEVLMALTEERLCKVVCLRKAEYLRDTGCDCYVVVLKSI